MSAGKIRGLHSHRWLVVACDTKLLMHDLSSNLSREVARTALDNKAPTSVAFLYINNPGLLGEASSLIHLHVCTSAYFSLLCDMLWLKGGHSHISDSTCGFIHTCHLLEPNMTQDCASLQAGRVTPDNNNNNNRNAFQLMMSSVHAGQVLSLQSSLSCASL